ncbi:MAG TPA: glycoside hydrolase family 127 protein [bacterium]|nr:glycoside hydrolase family 127 protein [bacterium]
MPRLQIQAALHEHRRIRHSAFGIRISVFLAVFWFGLGQSSAGQSPFAKVEPLPLGAARWTDGFWADRFELCRTQMIPSMEALMEGTNYTQFFRNFEIAAGLVKGKSRGAPFNDGDFYKWMEGAAASLAVVKNPALEARLDEIISIIARAQRADGYLHTPVQIRALNGDTNAVPFGDRNNFEMYNLGHLMTTAVVYHRVTGKTNLLAVALKAADFLITTFSNAPENARSSVCPSHLMGLADLYRDTQDPRYLELARTVLRLRSEITDGGSDNQDRIPFGQQQEAEGHAVRANYLYAGAADLFLETGDEGYWKPLPEIWTNVVTEKMYITGGCGALYDGAAPDGSKDQKHITRVHQAYGRNYQLPNTTAHNETCANIGNALWNWRMFLATGEARFMDVVELELYNAVLSGVSLDGTNFFYTNPLRVTDPLPVDLRWSRTRVPFVSSFCCPPNLVRTIAESSGYGYAKSDDAIWVNLYGGSSLATELAGETIKLSQETEYPWSGRVRIKIETSGQKEFALKLRIPGWARGATVRVNDRPAAAATAESYFEIRRQWQAGDVVDVDLPMSAHLMEANPLVEDDFNQVAIQRGPVVYCLESPDLPTGVKISDVRIPADIQLRARYDRKWLDGIVVLEGTALARAGENWSGKLYREVRPTALKPIAVKFIPYSVWQNRGPSEMSVWLPRVN